MTLDALTNEMTSAWANGGDFPEWDDIPEELRKDAFQISVALLQENRLLESAAREAFDMPEILGMPQTGYSSVTVTCDRCKELIHGSESPNITAGFYRVRDDNGNESSFAWYTEPHEKVICDACMHGDPRYKAAYGV